MKLRYEDFGAIVALDEPPMLVHVDAALVRSLGYPPSPRWAAPRGHLSAPTEVHLMTTNRCPAGCPGCYTGATPAGAERPTAEVMTALDRLAAMGVFHVALGGGEAMLRPDLFAIAAHARSVGLVPNLTTSGIGLTAALAARCRVFGRVNVSLDGVGPVYARSRGYDGSGVALRALKLLSEAGVACGVNYVLGRQTFDALPETLACIAEAGADEVELLRFKPAGRGAAVYAEHCLTEAQGRALMPLLRRLAAEHPAVTLKVDCSFVPFLCAADPPIEQLERFGVYGCEAGHALAAITAELRATPCSFVEADLGDAGALAERWDDHPELLRWRHHHRQAPAPCADCPYRTVCKGGCRVVAQHVEGDAFAPDPECPRVLAHRRGVPFEPVVLP